MRLIFVLLILSQSMFGQDKSIFELIDSLSTEPCTLQTDIKFLTVKKHIEEYVPSILKIGEETYNVQLRTRGNARKKICFTPPFKIKFDKEEIEVPEPNSFKLVNCCKNNDISEQLLVKEFLAYKLYSIITEKSLDAVLLTITYEDVKGKRKPSTRKAMLLEDEESFALKFEGVTYEPRVTFSGRLDTFQLAVMTVFEYMIGNTDWAIGNQHNCFVVRNQSGLPFPVPYDFDYSGLVNAEYAVPQASTPIDHVKTRYNRGRCIQENHFKEVRSLYLAKKEEILNYIDNFPHLNKASHRESMRFMNDFFDALENERASTRTFCRDCRE